MMEFCQFWMSTHLISIFKSVLRQFNEVENLRIIWSESWTWEDKI